jgi:hypothetical protein
MTSEMVSKYVANLMDRITHRIVTEVEFTTKQLASRESFEAACRDNSIVEILWLGKLFPKDQAVVLDRAYTERKTK